MVITEPGDSGQNMDTPNIHVVVYQGEIYLNGKDVVSYLMGCAKLYSNATNMSAGAEITRLAKCIEDSLSDVHSD